MYFHLFFQVGGVAGIEVISSIELPVVFLTIPKQQEQLSINL